MIPIYDPQFKQKVTSPGINFAKEHDSKAAPVINPMRRVSSGNSRSNLTRTTSRNTLRQVSSRNSRGRRASVVASEDGDTGVRRLTYFSYNDDPNTDMPDVMIGHGTTDIETGARLPYNIGDEDQTEDDENMVSDVIVVEWDGDDKELGTNWSLAARAYCSVLIGLLTVCSTIASSLPSMLIPVLVKEFGVSSETMKVALFIFVAGYCVGPLVWAPISEVYGIRWPLIISTLGATIFNMACALSPNITGLILFRFLAGTFGSCTFVVGGGTMANIWTKELIGLGMTLFAMSPMAGPAVGPLIGGWIVVEHAAWQWGFWTLTIFSGFMTILSFFTLWETNPNMTLKKKAKRLRKETGDDRYKAPVELRKIDFKELVTRWLLLPILMLIYEPMLQAITMYISFIYGLLYLFFEAYPIVFMNLHGLNALQCGLTFQGFLAGCISAGAFYALVENKRYVTKMRASPTGNLAPEERLRPAIYGAPILVICLFWFAWTSYEGVSIWSPIVAGSLFGISMFFVFFSLFTYMADTYRAQTASALSANTMVRSAFGFGFPLVCTLLKN